MAAATFPPRVLGDVGGTNARFALQTRAGGPAERVRTYPTAGPGLAEAIRRYLDDEGVRDARTGAIGIANPVTGDHVRMTNNPWEFSIDATRRALGFERLVVINDFQALALSLPALTDDQKQQIGGAAPEAGEPLALVGPGTGLGVSALLCTRDGGTLAIDGEGGHVTLAAADDEEAAVIAQLRTRFEHVSAERALSGQGLENLYEALAALDGRPRRLPAPDITAGALAGADPLAGRAVALFCAFLGGVAGDVALTVGARGGVYVGGGIVPRLGPLFAASPFRARFEAKGRMAEYLRPIPVYVITADVSPALLGAARALEAALAP